MQALEQIPWIGDGWRIDGCSCTEKNMHLSDFNMIFGKGNKNLYDFGENMSLVEKNKVPPFCLPCLKISRSPRNLVWSHWRTCSSIPSHSVVTSSQGPLAPSRKSVKSEFPARNVDCQIAPHMIYHDISLNSRSVEAGFKRKCLYINICPMHGPYEAEAIHFEKKAKAVA